MTMNLVEQQNMLRELSDGQLTQAMNSGVTPQYLVVAEAKRREDARKRYANLKQKYDASQGTVTDMVMRGLGPSAMQALGGGQQMGGMPGGIDAAMPPDQGAAPPPDMGGGMPPDMGGGLDAAAPPDMQPQGYARGGAVHRYATPGVVSAIFAPDQMDGLLRARMAAANSPGLPAALPAAVPAGPTANEAALSPLSPISYTYPEFQDPYSGLRDLYSKQIADLDKERERASALAMISAGLGIAGGKSQNFARNLAGAQDAIANYETSMQNIDTRKQALMQGQTGLAAQSQQMLSEMKKNFPDTAEGRRQMAVQMGMDTTKPEVQAFIATGQNAELAFGMKGAIDYGDFVDGENTATGEAMKARLNPLTNQFEDPQGNPIDFRPFTQDEIEFNRTRKRDLAKSLLTGKTYRASVATLDGVKRKTESANSTMNDIQGLLQQGSLTGPFSLLAKFQSGTPQYALISKVEKLKSNIATTVLQDLRAQSEDGSSGFGQLTKNEFDALQNSLGNLDTFQDAETFSQTIEDVRQQLNDIYRKAGISLMAALSEKGNAELRDQKFEENMGVLLDLQAIDKQIAGFAGAQPASSGSTDTGPMSTVKPLAPEVSSDPFGDFMQSLNPFQ